MDIQWPCNQGEAETYLRTVYGAKHVHAMHLSILNRYGHGPDVLAHKGNQKLFTKEALDNFAAKQGWKKAGQAA